jgi:hypothetical protein
MDVSRKMLEMNGFRTAKMSEGEPMSSQARERRFFSPPETPRTF